MVLPTIPTKLFSSISRDIHLLSCCDGNLGKSEILHQKYRAFNDGIEKLKEVGFDFIGNLDADVSFGPLYFERLLEEFVRNPRLGIAGGEIIDVYQKQGISSPCQ